ncbi:MAG TPA: amidohydrolase [Candidatus Limnocylindrales bacterium]|nr:amidohydrolase [Candidatus Limnocylindrales bacterium]
MTRAILFHGGRIDVGDGTHVEALLARDGRVSALGSASDLRRDARDVERVDLRGGAMVPGWVDAHVHFIWWALQMSQLDLRETKTVDDALASIAAYARRLPPDAWILGGRFDKNVWGKWPSRADLDKVTAGRPAALRSRDGHSRWVNTAALARAGVTRESIAPAGGTIFHDENGEPSGILQENANGLIDAVIPPPTDDEMIAAARLGQREAWKRGLVGFESLDAFRDRHPLSAFQRLNAAGELGLRAIIGLPRAKLDEALALGLRTGFGDEWVRIGHLKFFTDGALGSQTAALEEPYAGSDDRGILTIEPETLTQEVGRAALGGIAVAIHAIGDRAVHVALNAIQATRRIAPELRQKIEHVQLVRADDLGRFAELGVIASMQPIHATSDRDLADRYWGPERTTRAYPWRTLLASGAVLAFGSDAPVEPIDPILGIHAAVARRRPGDADAWTPAQKLTLAEALAGYARGPAYALGRERDAGTLAVGMLCDATVVDRDIAAISEGELHDVRVRATITGGVVRYADGLG